MSDNLDETSAPELTADEEALLGEMPGLTDIGGIGDMGGGQTPRAFFDVTEEDDPRVLQMSASAQHLETFERGLSEALTIAERSDREVEVRLLRVDHGFVVRRPVAEAEEQARGDAVATDVLDQIAIRERLPVQGPQREKAMNQAFRMTDGQRLAGFGGYLPERGNAERQPHPGQTGHVMCELQD
jgi:hypothetical protein